MNGNVSLTVNGPAPEITPETVSEVDDPDDFSVPPPAPTATACVTFAELLSIPPPLSAMPPVPRLAPAPILIDPPLMFVPPLYVFDEPVIARVKIPVFVNAPPPLMA